VLCREQRRPMSYDHDIAVTTERHARGPRKSGLSEETRANRVKSEKDMSMARDVRGSPPRQRNVRTGTPRHQRGIPPHPHWVSFGDSFRGGKKGVRYVPR